MEITLRSRWETGSGVRIGQSGTISDYRGIVEAVEWNELERDWLYTVRWLDDETELVSLPQHALKQSHMDATWVSSNGPDYDGARRRRGVQTAA